MFLNSKNVISIFIIIIIDTHIVLYKFHTHILTRTHKVDPDLVSFLEEETEAK